MWYYSNSARSAYDWEGIPDLSLALPTDSTARQVEQKL